MIYLFHANIHPELLLDERRRRRGQTEYINMYLYVSNSYFVYRSYQPTMGCGVTEGGGGKKRERLGMVARLVSYALNIPLSYRYFSCSV